MGWWAGPRPGRLQHGSSRRRFGWMCVVVCVAFSLSLEIILGSAHPAIATTPGRQC
jgi:hypothetical protein